MLIAAVEHRHKVVWGFGKDRQAAYAHAIEELARKVDGLEWDRLDYCLLDDKADISADGNYLYQFIIQDASNGSDQLEFF